MNQNNWQPDMEKVSTIIRLIEYIQSSDNAKQKEAFERFHTLKKNEEFSAYCAAIFSRKELKIEVRRQSGLLLKEALRHNFKKQTENVISSDVLSVCKKCLLECLCEEKEGSKFIRNTSAIAIATIVRELHAHSADVNITEFDEWPDLVDTLLSLLKQHQNDKNPVVITSILNLVHLLCHDCGKIMGECRSAKSLVQCLLGFASSSNHSMRHHCLQSLYYLLHYQPPSLLQNTEQYIALILQCVASKDQSPETVKVLIDSIIVLMNEHWDKLSRNHNRDAVLQIFMFMLNGTMSEDNEISTNAAEFWALYATAKSLDNAILIEFFPKLLPVLVKRCRYSNDLLALIDFDNDDQSKADQSEDVKPVFYQSRSERAEEQKDDDAARHNMDEEEYSWNIRKSCATQLEKLSFCGGDLKEKLLEHVLPIIKQALESKDFLDREAGLLILGAVTQSEFESIIPSLPELIPFIMEQCKADKHVLVQQIAYWSLARFSSWYYKSKEGGQFWEKVLYLSLNGMKSNSKRVQRAACGAIATFLTATHERVMSKKEYVEALMNTFLTAFKVYRLRNFPHLIDVIISSTTVIVKHTKDAHSEDNVLCNPQFQDALLPPILQRWLALEGDPNVFPLFEAITQWTSFIGHTEHFQKTYLKEIFVSTLRIAITLKNECREYDEYQRELHGRSADEVPSEGEDENEPDKPEKEFWVCALDLLAVLVEKCSPAIEQLVWVERDENGGPYWSKVLEMMFCSIRETQFNVRRNGLALLGDMFTSQTDQMEQHVPTFLRVVIANLQWDWQTVCTNASWSIGQCLAEYGPQSKRKNSSCNQDVALNSGNTHQNVMDPHCDEILNRLVGILKEEKSPEYMVTNIAITMARLVRAYPDRIIKKWDCFAVEWIGSLAKFQEDQDKIDAFKTLMATVMKNPVAVVQSRNGCRVLFESIAQWQQPPPELNEQFKNVLNGFKNAAPSWDKLMGSMEPEARQKLKDRYGV